MAKQIKATGKPVTAKDVIGMTAEQLMALAASMTAKSPAGKAAAKAAKGVKPLAKPQLTEEQRKEVERQERKAKAEIARMEFAANVVSAFQAAGFKDAKPKVNVLTAKLWADKGFAVKPGARPVLVQAPWSKSGGYTLFHRSQVEPVKAPA